MTDIVQRLRHADEYEPLLGHDAWKAADTIEALQSRIRALEEALRPLADRAASYDGVPPPKYFGDTDCELRFHDDAKAQITVGDLRRARDVLKGEVYSSQSSQENIAKTWEDVINEAIDEIDARKKGDDA